MQAPPQPSLAAACAAAAAAQMPPPAAAPAAAPATGLSAQKASTNLAVLRRHDASVEQVLAVAGQVALYNLDTDTQEWVRARARRELRAGAALSLGRTRPAPGSAFARGARRRTWR